MNSKIVRRDKNCRFHIMPVLLISILIIAILYLVYITGGTKKVFLHLMYLPIILSALFWGDLAGLITGAVCGLLAGPLMPLDVAEGVMQDPINWIFRMFIFSLIGFLTGNMTEKIHSLNEEKQERNLKSPFYDLPNAKKLFYDIENNMKTGEHFKLISIKLTNLHEIEKYVDNKLVFEIVNNLAKKLMQNCGRKAVYSHEKDELIILACGNCAINYEEKIKNILGYYFDFPISINEHKIRVSFKVGIYVYQGEESTPIEIYNKARIAYEQGDDKESGIYYYDVGLENKRRVIHSITGSMLESIQRNELFLVYQPKIDIQTNKISGVEALVRWKRNGNEFIGPNVFIPIAEEIGFINKISKFVFDHVTTQMEIWKSKGMNLKCAVNASVNELTDDGFTAWVKEVVASKNIDHSDLEIEITERDIAYDDNRLIKKMNFIKEKGYNISIDDFGTGYNSLMSVSEIPFDKLKIDKYFIERIHKFEIVELIKHFIEYAHSMGKTVIAEGVETKEQLNILKDLKCDEVQGYYYSKPLLPEELETFYIEFNKATHKSA
ncbi:MAG: c-di-GMP phosphodiesterase [Epulopiscium sp.]|uniref:EAL domain-containing protein n=1 Tax=Defluviitalea raffinosedens TaxID=1450156 RepID=A0A7C8LQB1_9FIRM|nr:EAL domain-containing protein [Defluviitalea raffinosedens]KAE9634901.1 EAL domain-containing protein [Defluviitalea raffinosedens]MBM7685692.1 EAL domain-containing protein (putative c-di-GMP-specific phosphodiesterase class I) [Defluviitalea raffinosedens]MBZ4667448.1 hypothetical protein [Defluviitaleaceae bacterium]MDK2787085.1 c-di-GMP phosphodiesterase [Candidatus Epulonipiscium sp.]